MIKRYKTNSQKRKTRVRSKIRGTSAKPRLTVYRSLKEIYAQIIDDSQGITLAAASSLKLDQKSKPKINKTQVAVAVGENIAKAALSKKITTVVFDRGSYKYHGRIKAVAEAAREKGLKF